MGKVLYRSYRAKNFDEVIGQDHITKSIKNSLKKGRPSHAYLLTGPRGVGKTSIARIIAHKVNSLPYNGESLPVDIIEIDAASNRRIDEIRDIKEKAAIAPVSSNYKVYIIDEVHMLTKEAANALLKTLEEPPDHVIFILATTELHKLPETIISRCAHFAFKPIAKQHLSGHLTNIAKSEKINVDSKAIDLIAEHGMGSFRDSISILDQLRGAGSKITAEDVRASLGLAPGETIEAVISALEQRDARLLLKTLGELREFGADEAKLAKQISFALRQRLIESKLALEFDEVSRLLKNLLAIPSSVDPAAELELSLLEPIIKSPAAGKQTVPEITQTAATGDVWETVLNRLKTDNASLYSIARIAEANLGDRSVTLKFQFPFHLKQMAQPKNTNQIKDILRSISAQDYEVIIEKKQPSTSKKDKKPKHKSINNIFGSSEVLES